MVTLMPGALDLIEPRHLFAKLSHEIDLVAAEPRNSYAAINALRDAYHLREWIWHGRLKNDPTLQAQITGESAEGTPEHRECKSPKRSRGARSGCGASLSATEMSQRKWNEYINSEHTDFRLIRELCNGSKHFGPRDGDKVKATLTPGYGSPLSAYGMGYYGVDGLFVVLDGGGIVSVVHLLQSVRTFWAEKFERFPQL